MHIKEKLIFWELNEINFDYVKFYIDKGRLPNWKKMIENHGISSTISNENYDQLQPWIQWPTIRTGLNFSDHKLYRIGDIIGSGIRQHWEILEERGLNVAAMSPINAANNTNNASFWIPDPWTDTAVSGNGFVKRFSKVLKQVVNDNANEKISFFSGAVILETLLFRSKISSWPTYLRCFFGALKKQHWSKAIFFDRLLADTFINLWKINKPDFSSIWVNGGAHIQHHYLFSSEAYKGSLKNPEWYIKNNKDPLLEILEMYDSFLDEIAALKNTRLIIAVAIKQVPYENPIFYWRLKNHDEFLQKLGINYKNIQPRMSIDFLVEFDNKSDLEIARKKLINIKTADGELIFSEVNIDKNKNLFVSLTYSGDINNNFEIFLDEKKYKNFRKDVSFVAIKNGHHNGQGYYLDSSKKPDELQEEFPLKNIFTYITEHFER